MSTPADRLRSALASRQPRPSPPPDFTAAPGPYEYETRRLITELEDELRELRTDIRKFWWTVIGAIVVSLLLQLVTSWR